MPPVSNLSSLNRFTEFTWKMLFSTPSPKQMEIFSSAKTNSHPYGVDSLVSNALLQSCNRYVEMDQIIEFVSHLKLSWSLKSITITILDESNDKNESFPLYKSILNGYDISHM